MRRALLAFLLLAVGTPPAAPAAERPAAIAEFLEIGGRPMVIAHRGFSAAAPENTLAAVRAAIEVGADMVEIDVSLSADGQLVVIHDETLDRTTDGRGEVAGMSLAEIRRLDAGSWFSPTFAGEGVPTLDEVLAEVESRVLLNVEIKSEAVKRGIVDKVAAAIRSRRMTEEVIVSSFSPAALEQMRSAAPEIRTAVLYNPDLDKGRDPVEVVRGVGASAFNVKRTRLTRAMLRSCRDAGIPVAVYTVDSPRRLRKVMERGVHAVFTNHPDRGLEVAGEASPGGGHAEPAPRPAAGARPGTGKGSTAVGFAEGAP